MLRITARRVALSVALFRRSIVTSVAAGSRRSLAMPLAAKSSSKKPDASPVETVKSSSGPNKSHKKEAPTKEVMAAHYEKCLDHAEEHDPKSKATVKARTLSGEAGRISF